MKCKNTLMQQALNTVETSPHPIPYGFGDGYFQVVVIIFGRPYTAMGKADPLAFCKKTGAFLHDEPYIDLFDASNSYHDIGDCKKINTSLALMLAKGHGNKIKAGFRDIQTILDHAFIYKVLELKPLEMILHEIILLEQELDSKSGLSTPKKDRIDKVNSILQPLSLVGKNLIRVYGTDGCDAIQLACSYYLKNT
jgi:hypothetical protein